MSAILGATACIGMAPRLPALAAGQDSHQSAVISRQDSDPSTLAPQDRARTERQLRDLEDQRAKLDDQIRTLRRQLRRDEPGVTVTPRVERRELTPEIREEIDRAMAQARKAQEDAMKALRDSRAFGPDGSLRLYTTPNGQGMTPEQREQLRKQMQELRANLRNNLQGLRVNPPVIMAPGTRSTDPELREEIRQLRRELDQLRDEIRSQRNRTSGTSVWE